MLKKVLSLICVLALVLSLGACSRGKTESGGTDGSDVKVGTKADLKGKTITFASYNDLYPNKGSSTYTQELALWKQIENDYNCKLECIRYTDFNAYHKNLLVSVLANEHIGDVFYASAEKIVPKWTNSNLLVPIGDYIDLQDDTVWATKLINSDYTIDGKGYCALVESGWIGTVIMFNKRICRDAGITDDELYALQKSGNWTWDKLREYAIKTTKVDANGITEIYGFSTKSSAPISAEPFIISNGAYPVKVNADKSYSWNLDAPEVMEAIQYCYDLVFTDKVSYTKGYGQGPKLWEGGKLAFYAIGGWDINETVYEKLKGDEYGILLMPKGPRATGYINSSASVSGWFMQDSTEDKETVGKILTDYVEGTKEIDKITNPNNTMSGPIIQYLYDDESAEILDSTADCTILAPGGACTWFCENVLWGGWGQLDKTPPSTFVASVKNESIKAFNDMLTITAE